MNFFRGLFEGIRAYGKAMELLLDKRFRWFLWFPIGVVVLLFWGGNYLTNYLGSSLSDWIQQQIGIWISGISWLHWLDSIAGFLIRVFTKILYFFLFISFGGYVVMVVMSPVYSWLSERVEAHLSEVEYPFSWHQLGWEIARGIGMTLRCLIFQTALMLLLFILSFIPVVGLIIPFLTFGLTAYFYGFAFMDYAVERKRFKIKESMHYMKRNAGTVIGIGSVFALALLIPFVRIIACCFVSLLAVIAGTVVVENREINTRK